MKPLVAILFALLLARSLSAVVQPIDPPNPEQSRSVGRMAISERPALPAVTGGDKEGWGGGEIPPLTPPAKPMVEVTMRDPSICRGPDNSYYLIGTTGPNMWRENKGIEMWKSSDLKTWKYLGYVWTFEKDAKADWQRGKLNPDGTRTPKPLWAPELHYIKGQWYIAACVEHLGCLILKSTSGLPEGPYADIKSGEHIIPPGSHDASLFEDDDGQVYFLCADARIARMKPDMSDLAEPLRHVTVAPDTKWHNCEGPTMMKLNGRYYLFVAQGTDHSNDGERAGPGAKSTYDIWAMSASTPYGPFEKRHLAFPRAGHNVVFQDHTGRWWSTWGTNTKEGAVGLPFFEKPAIIPIEMDSEGKLRQAPSPENPQTTVSSASAPIPKPTAFDFQHDKVVITFDQPMMLKNETFSGFSVTCKEGRFPVFAKVDGNKISLSLSTVKDPFYVDYGKLGTPPTAFSTAGQALEPFYKRNWTGTEPAKAEKPPVTRLSAIAKGLKWIGKAVDDPDAYIWCTSPIQGPDGKIHLFCSRIPKKYGFAWTTRCEIAHYVGDKPEGPFRFVNIAIPCNPEAPINNSMHNPAIAKVGDKYVLLYITFDRRPDSPWTDNGKKKLMMLTGMAISDSLDGPWKPIGKDGLVIEYPSDPNHWLHRPWSIDNPTFLAHGGKFYVYFKSSTLQGWSRYGYAVSDKLEGPYKPCDAPVTENISYIEDATAFEWNGKICLVTNDNHGKHTGIPGAGILWTSDTPTEFKLADATIAFLKTTDYAKDVDTSKARNLYGNEFKFERPGILMLDGNPAYFYGPSGVNLDGDDHTVSYVMKIDLNQSGNSKPNQ